VSGTASAGIFSIYAASPQSIFLVGGDYTKENERSVNFAKSSDGGKTWVSGPELPGYRSAIHAVSNQDEALLVAAGPSGTDLISVLGGRWTSVGTTGYDAVSFEPAFATGWAVGPGGRIAKWQRLP
jgi:hypothetical protein